MENSDESIDEFNTFDLQCGVPENPKITEIWKSRIHFDWRKLPVSDHGLIYRHPVDNGEKFEVLLNSGIEISLNSIYQDKTYDGLLEGMPINPDAELRESYKKALDLYKEMETQPFILPPVMDSGRIKWSGIEEIEDWKLLPRIRSIAKFSAANPARDSSQNSSSLVVIWFQQEYGIPKKEQFLEIDWNSLAWDWCY